jgi:hypothetical protein
MLFGRAVLKKGNPINLRLEEEDLINIKVFQLTNRQTEIQNALSISLKLFTHICIMAISTTASNGYPAHMYVL